jgi:hypothetical protein
VCLYRWTRCAQQHGRGTGTNSTSFASPTPSPSTLLPRASHTIIRGASGRRHEIDFGDAQVRVDIYPSEETIEIFVEADFDTLPEERRRFALLNIPRHLFSEATAAAARRAANRRPASSP